MSLGERSRSKFTLKYKSNINLRLAQLQGLKLILGGIKVWKCIN